MRKIKKTAFLLFFSWALCAAQTTANAQQPQLPVSELQLENTSYPYPVYFMKMRLQSQDLEMAYMDVKPAKWNNKTVVLLHGKNFNGLYWKKTAEALLQKGFRVVIPDQIGFGKSSKPIHFQYSFAQLAANTKAVLDFLDIKSVSVLGHSMGGMLATRFALQYPNFTEKLILENPIGLEDYQLYQPYKTVDAVYELELKQDYNSLKKYQLEYYYDNKWKLEYDTILNPLAGWTLNKKYDIIAWNAALTMDMIITQPVCYEFKNLKLPTLLLIGQRDRTCLGDRNLAPEKVREQLGNYSLLGEKTKKAIKKSKLVKLSGIGHLPHIEDFEAFIPPVINFLEK